MSVGPAPPPDDLGEDYRTSPHPPGGCGLAVLLAAAGLAWLVLGGPPVPW